MIWNLHLSKLISMDFPKFLLHFSIIFIKILNMKSTGKNQAALYKIFPVKLVL